MGDIMNAAAAALAAYDVSLQRQWREEERTWREEDMQWRSAEQGFMANEAQFTHEERGHVVVQLQQAHLDNARALWLRFVERNRREVAEKTEQLKALSSLSALVAGFALVSFLEFNLPPGSPSTSSVLPLFATTTAVTVAVEMSAVVVCSLMLASILRTGKSYVSEQEEAEFMTRCRAFCLNYSLGDRPPAPQRTFAAHWSQRCESEWRTAFRLFSLGIPFFFANLMLAGWLQFHDTLPAAVLVTIIMGLSMLYNFYNHRKWSNYLLEDDAMQEAHPMSLASMGLPFDWHLPGCKPSEDVTGDTAEAPAPAPMAGSSVGGRAEAPPGMQQPLHGEQGQAVLAGSPDSSGPPRP